MRVEVLIAFSVVEYHNALSDLADVCQILSLPLAVWGLWLALRKKTKHVARNMGLVFKKKSLLEKVFKSFFEIEPAVKSFKYYI